MPTHPALVHVPLGLAFAVPIVALVLLLALWRGAVSRRSFAIVLLLQALLVGGALFALRAGLQEGERVARIVPDTALENHEERAERFVWTAAAVLGGFAAVLVVPRRAAGPLAALATAGAFATAGLAYLTGKAGGELVYTYGAARAYGSGATTAAAPPSVRPQPRRPSSRPRARS
jgi:uncharacterized membrane protein